MKRYIITEVVSYSVRANSPAAAEKKFLLHVKAFKDDVKATKAGVEFIEVSEREVERALD